ncbi:hypothetical protein FGADI_10632 [Fusarium gaditjirri]|uniref:Uncharacterized protein n=1 Tax=Fusarium gaditjirri TaxID=282569 RepID=A0A8H4WRC0_9HYPO|nr:hypothetical protein FGADI_10632 [Fusarium gaditjirri]
MDFGYAIVYIGVFVLAVISSCYNNNFPILLEGVHDLNDEDSDSDDDDDDESDDEGYSSGTPGTSQPRLCRSD